MGDIGTVWTVLASRVAGALGIKLDFMSYNQSTAEGIEMREWIVENIRPLDRDQMIDSLKDLQ